MDGLLRRLLKCSVQHSFKPIRSLIKVVPSEGRGREKPDLEGPYTVFSEPKNWHYGSAHSFEFLRPCPATSGPAALVALAVSLSEVS